MSEKRCCRCKLRKALGAFGSNKSRSDGLSPTCRACTKIADAHRRPRKREVSADPNLKRCCVCKVWKERSKFGMDISRPDNLNIRCRACTLTKSREYYISHLDEERARSAKYYLTHLDERLDACAKYRTANRDKVRTRISDWGKKHPERKRAYWRRYQAFKNNAPGRGFTVQDEMDTLKKWNWTCAYCGCDLTGLPSKQVHMDHVLALSKGGAHDSTNIVPACRACNSKKGTKIVLPLLRKEG